MQLSVAVMAIFRSLKSTEKLRVTWSMLALVFGLMTFRRVVSLGLSMGIDIPFVFPEVIAFSISLLLCVAVYNIGKILPSLENIVHTTVPETSMKLKDIAGQLSREIIKDYEDIDKYKDNAKSLIKSRESLANASEKLVNIAHTLESLTSNGKT
jgi:hypothetical protein